MAILAVIMAAVAAIFMTAIKNYRSGSQKTALQRDLNFTLDSMIRDVKQATNVLDSYDTYTLSGNTLILALPAENASDNFVYTGNTLVKDYVVYFLDGNNLKRKIYANPAGSRSSSENSLLNNVSALTFTYLPDAITKSGVKINITTEANAGRTITLSEEGSANLRNYNE